METFDIKDLGMNVLNNLCDSCLGDLSTCNSGQVAFGSGEGNDNVAACSDYEPIESN